MRTGSMLSASCAFAALVTAHVDKRLNVLFILTDDQDVLMNSLDYMPFVQKHLISQGTSFQRHFCTVSLCCPSRVNLWTGQLSHNTNITNVRPPYGGYPKFVQNGYNDKHLALWMQKSGYNTYYTGKLYNSHSTDNYNKPAPKGYTESDFLLDPYTYQYYNFSTSRNAQEPVNRVGEYSPDYVAKTAYEYLDMALEDGEKPWFLTVAPVAPHCEGSGFVAFPAQCAERHKDLFKDYKIPRTLNFNPDVPSCVSWVAELEKLNETLVEYNDEYQRQRLRSLQSVDEMVDQLVAKLEQAGELENTHIFYSSDNGYHISQHRLHPGKMLGLEEDTRVPLIWRGPGIPAGEARMYPTSHSDLAPTLMKIAGLSIDDPQFDGLPLEIDEMAESRSESIGIEFWGPALAETPMYQHPDGLPPMETGMYLRNTYKALRVEAEDYGFYYSVWCTNEVELYDMKADPGQMSNLLQNGGQLELVNEVWGTNVQQLTSRLDALMMVLKSCKEKTCTHPWEALHPDGRVKNLKDALKCKYDGFYEQQPKVRFDLCQFAYIPEMEGPQEYIQYGRNLVELRSEEELLDGHDWSFWE